VEDVEVHAEGGAIGALGGREEGKEGGREAFFERRRLR
jgi:hypothetical protein